MSNEQVPTLTPEQFGIIKAGAADAYRQMGIRPETANYVFLRFLQKQAAAATPKPSEKAVKLAEALRAKLHAGQQPAPATA